jgi:GNAT superfamily N-acetyltransferase
MEPKALTDEIDIRFFRQDDTEPLTDLLEEMSRHYNGNNASARDIVKRNLIDNILGPDSDVRIVVARHHARLVGVAMISILYPTQKERGQLFRKELYVAADSRSKGTGRQLMRWIAQYALAKNCSRFDWTVGVENTKAVALYRSLGATHLSDRLYFRFEGNDLQEFARGDREGG